MIYSQVNCIEITHKAQLDITHKLTSIAEGPSHRVPSMRILDLILHLSLQYLYYSKDFNTSISPQYMRILVGLDITHNSTALIPITRLENDSWCCTINKDNGRQDMNKIWKGKLKKKMTIWKQIPISLMLKVTRLNIPKNKFYLVNWRWLRLQDKC